MGKTNEKRRIYMSGGSKGGVGKSMLTMALLDYLIEDRGASPLLIDTDTSNPDVYKAYSGKVEALLIDLDEADGWIELVNRCSEHTAHSIIINTAARNNTTIAKFGETLSMSLPELAVDLVTFWVINRQRDSLELLREFMTSMPESSVHVVRNEFFGPHDRFTLFNASQTRREVEDRGGIVLTFPRLADRVAEDIYSRRMTIDSIATTAPIGNRAEAQKWRRSAKRMFDQVIA